MAFGMSAPGKSPEHDDGQFRSLAEYREHIRRNVRQGLLDIMLMSVSSNEILTIRERIFDGSTVTPAIRANDTTDIHVARGATYPQVPARPFRTALLDHAQCGQVGCNISESHLGANLGLFSMTFNNDVNLDREMLEAYKAFRIEAEQRGFRHFLEVFTPNAMVNPIPSEQLGGFLNDMIARSLAGVPSSARPLFLKIPYPGPAAMEELARYDPHLVPGILGSSAGTTYDAFKLLAEAKAHGAKAALFGRKINNAEHQLSFIQFLRWIADGEIGPEEATKAYHGVLAGLGIQPHRSLEEDMQLTSSISSYGSSGRTISIPRTPAGTPATVAAAPGGARLKKPADESPGDESAGNDSRNADISWPTKPDGLPDFAKMTPQQKLTYHQARLNRTIG